MVGVTGVQKSQVAEAPGFQAAPDLQRSQGTEGEKGQELVTSPGNLRITGWWSFMQWRHVFLQVPP